MSAVEGLVHDMATVLSKDRGTQARQNLALLERDPNPASIARGSSRPARIEEKGIRVGGLRVNYLTAGSGPDMLLMLHGGVSSSARLAWSENILAFAPYFTVIAPDLPGYGSSEKPAGRQCTHDYYLGFVKQFMEAVGITKASMIGNSMGGGILLGHALENKGSVKDLVLVGTFGLSPYPLKWPSSACLASPAVSYYGLRFIQNLKFVRQASEGITRLGVRRVLGDGVDNEKIVSALGSDRRVQRAFHEFLADQAVATPRDMLRHVVMKTCYADRVHELKDRVRTLVIHGEDDSGIDIKPVKEVVDRTGFAKFEPMEECGHSPQTENPERFNAIVLEFLVGSRKEEAEKPHRNSILSLFRRSA